MSTAIFYASSSGNTEEVAEKIIEKFENIDSYDLTDNAQEISKASNYDKLIFASSTWGDGDLQDDWDEAFDELKDIDFTSKTVALVGLGDQEGYDDTFVNALGTLYDELTQLGANIVGHTNTDGYEFEETTAIRDGKFVGLVIDEDNQDDLTDERIDNWFEEVKNDLV